MTFQSARRKLTIIYTSILALILCVFSIAIYNLAMEEVYRSVQEVHVRLRDEYGIFMRPERVVVIDTEALDIARKNIIVRLLLTNVAILAAAAGASYYLAGRTLKPVQEMTKQQQQFVADASHELRTPLTVMKSTTEVTLRDQHLTLDEAKTALSDNLEEINRLHRLTNNLLTLSQNQDGDGLQLEALEIQPLLSKAVQVVQPLAQEKQIAIQAEETHDCVFADKDSLIEVIIILLENAIKYSKEHKSVEITVKSKGDDVSISIIDHGIGMNEESRKKIFDRFYRSENSRTSKGFGLGLAIAKKLIELQKGVITVKSHEGLGSIFSIILPKA